MIQMSKPVVLMANLLPAGNCWLGRLVLLVGGCAMALALPPWHIVPALLLFALLDRQSVQWGGIWLFAIGYHLVGLHWIAIAFTADAERFGALAIPGVVALSAILATITTLSILGALRLFGGQGWARPVALAVGWTLAELLRGPWGTQFPWNPTSLIWSVSDLTIQPIAWLGSEALGLLTLLAGLGLVRAITQRAWQPGLMGAGILVFLVAIGVYRLPPLVKPGENQPDLLLVQANIAQHHKWDQAKRREWFLKHVEFSRSPGMRPDIQIWPESSVPYSIEQVIDVGPLIAQSLKPGGVALVGSDFVDRSLDPMLLHNSVYMLDDQGGILDRYDKVQLVPFGEFLPFRQVLAPFGLEALAVGTVDFTPGTGRQLLDLPGLPAAGPLVCFEAAFAGMATAAGERPEWLLNVTNDAWFGISAGPYQHMNMARMRAVETGLPLVRAANTGISVVTDAYGRILSSLPLGEAGTIRQKLPEALPNAPPAGRHPAVAWGLFLILAAMSWILSRRIEVKRSPIGT